MDTMDYLGGIKKTEGIRTTRGHESDLVKALRLPTAACIGMKIPTEPSDVKYVKSLGV
jgi:hypothetical protein